MHPKEKPVSNYLDEIAIARERKKASRMQTENKKNTAEMNLRSMMASNPDAAEHMNIKFEDHQYADPFSNRDLHAPNRTFNSGSPM